MGFLITISEQQSLKSPQCENPMGTAPQRCRKTLYCFGVAHVCCDSLQWTSRTRDLCRWYSVL